MKYTVNGGRTVAPAWQVAEEPVRQLRFCAIAEVANVASASTDCWERDRLQGLLTALAPSIGSSASELQEFLDEALNDRALNESVQEHAEAAEAVRALLRALQAQR